MCLNYRHTTHIGKSLNTRKTTSFRFNCCVYVFILLSEIFSALGFKCYLSFLGLLYYVQTNKQIAVIKKKKNNNENAKTGRRHKLAKNTIFIFDSQVL